MADEGFHEIQLNGKQLVFLFMAATVVAVVIFLCGVMVGRGVRVQHGAAAAELSAQGADPTAAVTPVPVPAVVPERGSAALQEDLSYPDRLAGDAPPEPLQALPEPAPATSRPPAHLPEARTAALPAGAFTVQVAAVQERSEADTIARRLTTKGYDAYVTAPAPGAPRVFRVRVGRFRDRREAESAAARLEKEEHFKPWITR
jgi:cell division septation protein DedD